MSDATQALPEHSRLLAQWLGDRTQEEGARIIGIAQQTLSRVLAGRDAGLSVRIRCKRFAGVPLAAWPERAEFAAADEDLEETKETPAA